MQWRGVRRLSVRPSVNFRANRFFSQANSRIATKLAHDGLQVSLHPGCAQGQGQGQRSRDTRTFLDSWNELLPYSVIDSLVECQRQPWRQAPSATAAVYKLPAQSPGDATVGLVLHTRHMCVIRNMQLHKSIH